MDRLNRTNKRRITAKCKRAIASVANHLVEPAEWLATRSVGTKHMPFAPIFVVGPPRSGTTLVSQLLISSFQLGYVTNLMAYVYRAPFLTGLIANRILGTNRPETFQSNYGTVPGLTAPNEAGNFWRRWFTGPNATSLRGGVSGSAARAMRREVVALAKLYSGPILFKNTYNSARIRELAAVFPEALFLEVRRDVVETARSLLRGRMDHFQSKETWLGIKPYASFDLETRPYWQQVVEQVLLVREKIDRDRKVVGKHKFLSVLYADVCDSPRRELKRIQKMFQASGYEPTVIGRPPLSFKESFGKEISKEDLSKIKEYALARCRSSKCQGSEHLARHSRTFDAA